MRRKLPFLLVLLALMCVSLIPVSVAAQPGDDVSRQISALERQISKVLAKEGVSGPEDAYKLERLSSEESAALVEIGDQHMRGPMQARLYRLLAQVAPMPL